VFAIPSRDDMLTLTVDHRASNAHSLVARYAYDNQSIGGIKKPTWVVDGLRLGANSTDDIIHAHSAVAEDNWVLSSNIPSSVSAARRSANRKNLGGIT
jgi:hypothetical protein